MPTPPTQKTVKEIVASARAASDKLTALDEELEARIDEIRRLAFREKRDLTVAEKDERARIRGAQNELGEALVLLAAETLRQLDWSKELMNLKSQVDRVNAGLQDDLERLQAIKRYAALAAQVADTLAKVAERVAGALV